MRKENYNIIIGIVMGIILCIFVFNNTPDYTDEQREYIIGEGNWIENCR